MNCCDAPTAILCLTGVTPIEDRVAVVTVSADVPVLPVAVSVAVIVVRPAATEEADPLTAGLLMVATAVLDEDQVTNEVRSCFDRSE